MTDWLTHADPAAVAVTAGGAELSYGELRARVADAPLSPALLAEPTFDFVAGFHAVIARQAGTVLVDPRWTEGERAALSGPPARGVIVHTSGTTGAPKPITLTPENLAAAARATIAALDLAPGQRWLCPVPLSHVAGLLILVRCALAGATVVLGPAALEGADYVSLVPTQLKRLLDAGASSPASTEVILGGAPAPRPLLERAVAAGVAVRVAYGLTQTAAQVTLSAPGDLDTVGPPLPGAEIEVAPDGEVVVRGPMVSAGEVATGDLGAFTGDGRLAIIGRKVDTIVTGGENVAPAEVEAALLEHPAVSDAGVVGRADPEWGEAVTALVVARPGAVIDPDELRAHCASRLARFKVPKRVEFVAELPRTASGKLLRRAL
jgi:O-succinylbenzoic acid--CoA ligase